MYHGRRKRDDDHLRGTRHHKVGSALTAIEALNRVPPSDAASAASRGVQNCTTGENELNILSYLSGSNLSGFG